ncbi:hypothetical protein [Ichthyenterobacterium magnum]|uniref:HprK-related kinase A n=1 Tax=Ichthyenterobacterium magnum TaxID=1230530 RepID=A0A420DX61_9FLAO|nr:hypothetical protein [Ichthyenterobacterium magnum]RKE98832.1 hypothetical protein BXY80_0927 [Ichthyenterobacterium magnum]
MKGATNIGFSLSTLLHWKVESNNSSWLNENISEFKSSQQDSLNNVTWDICVKQVGEINLDRDAKNVSEGIYCLHESIYIIDKFSNKKAHFKIKNKSYELDVETGFTFHYYAALLDAFIKIIAFQKGIVTLHASAIKRANKVSVFAAWRRMGKTTAILNILNKEDTIQVLADDAVMITKEGKLIPYLRGIDLYPYLPIPQNYLRINDKLKRHLAKFLQNFPLLPNKLRSKVIKRFLLPRLNLAVFGHASLIESVEVDNFYAIKKHLKGITQKNNITASELKNFIGRSSYFEIIEYQAIFEMVCSVYPKSNFSKLIIDYKTFQDKVNHVISSDSIMLELNLSKDYSDIKDLISII